VEDARVAMSLYQLHRQSWEATMKARIGPHQEGQPQCSYTTPTCSGESSGKSTVQALHVTANGTSKPKSSTAV